MPKVTPAHTEARRQQILMAACQCMASKGFRQTSMQEICRVADLSPGAVYGYFKSKDEILRTMAEQGLQQSSELLREMDAAQEVRPLVRRIVTFLMECDRNSAACAPPGLDLNRAKVGLWAEAVQDPKIREMFEEQSSAFMKRLTTVVRRGQRGGEVRKGVHPEAVAQVIASLWEGLTLQRALDPELDVERYLEATFALLDGSLFANGDGSRPKPGRRARP